MDQVESPPKDEARQINGFGIRQDPIGGNALPRMFELLHGATSARYIS
ncbi:MAG: hypothetical protein ACI9GW_001536 [Halieaceae bacterium]|jgi:hypothetical protein